MFARLTNILKGMLSLFIKDIERQNPEALLELEQENLRKQIANFNQGLAAHAGLAERLMSQVRKQETEERELHARTTAHLRAPHRARGPGCAPGTRLGWPGCYWPWCWYLPWAGCTRPCTPPSILLNAQHLHS